jgi:hypothetical protein
MSGPLYVPPTPADYVSELAVRFALMKVRESVDQLLMAADKIETPYPKLAIRLREMAEEIAGQTLDYLRGARPDTHRQDTGDGRRSA